MRAAELAALIVLAAAMEVGAATGIAWLAGFGSTWRALHHLSWWWLLAMVASLAVSFAGYYYAGRGIYEVDSGPGLPGPLLRRVVLAGFGGFLSRRGGSLDGYALRAAGARRDDAGVRVTALAGLEQGVLGLIGCAAAIAVLVSGLHRPPPGFTVPWAVVPVPGFLLGFWLAERYEPSCRGRQGWRGKVGVFLRSILFVRRFFTTELISSRPAAMGMGVFWVADMWAVWCGMAAFGFRMNLAQMAVGVATGMVFTRRTGPLGGAGVLMLTLPLTLWDSGAPLGVAVLGVFSYRLLSTWLPLPVSVAHLPMLRAMGRHISPLSRAGGEVPLSRRFAASREDPTRKRS